MSTPPTANAARRVATEIVSREQSKCHRDGAGGVWGCIQHIRTGDADVAGGSLIAAIESAIESVVLARKMIMSDTDILERMAQAMAEADGISLEDRLIGGGEPTWTRYVLAARRHLAAHRAMIFAVEFGFGK